MRVREYAPPEPGPRTTCCWSGRVTVTDLGHGDYEVRITHTRGCHARRDYIARRRAELSVLDWLHRHGTFIPDYAYRRPRHRFRSAA